MRLDSLEGGLLEHTLLGMDMAFYIFVAPI